MSKKIFKCTLNTCLLLLTLLVFNSNCSYAARGFNVLPDLLITNMLEDKKEAQRVVHEKAKKDIEKTENPQELKKLAIESIDELDEQYKILSESTEKIEKERLVLEAERNELSRQKEILEEERDGLKVERDTLTQEKEDLKTDRDKHEQNLRLFSMGFYGSLSAAVIAIASIIVRFPTIRLDKRLKHLEILEKEYQLKENQVSIK
jgi:hypothetical protein